MQQNSLQQKTLPAAPEGEADQSGGQYNGRDFDGGGGGGTVKNRWALCHPECRLGRFFVMGI